MSELGPDEKTDAWRAIWYLENVDNLNPYRDNLREILYNLLDYEKETKLPPAELIEDKKPKQVKGKASAGDITDPKHYLFGSKKLWIPWAEDGPKAVKRGTYKRRYPEGAVIHWTAGHRKQIQKSMQSCQNSKLCYFVIGEDGEVGQGFPLNRWGYHAGASSYKGLKDTVSNELVGIEVQAAGSLTKKDGHYYPWWDQDENDAHRFLKKNWIPADEVVYSKTRGNIDSGYYHKYTPAQFWALTKTILWLRLNNPDVFSLDYVLGHDDVSPGRKVDPGAALVNPDTEKPMTTSEYRDYLADLEAEVLERREEG